jgi:hypothetical protein
MKRHQRLLVKKRFYDTYGAAIILNHTNDLLLPGAASRLPGGLLLTPTQDQTAALAKKTARVQPSESIRADSVNRLEGVVHPPWINLQSAHPGEAVLSEFLGGLSAIRKYCDKRPPTKAAGVPHGINTWMCHARDLTDEQWKILDH